MKTSVQKRLAPWQAAHGQLLRHDFQYRKRFFGYIVALISLSCVLLVFYLPFFGVRLFGPMTNVFIILGLATAIVCLSIRQVLFQRRSIRRYLKSAHPA